jgi:acetyl-CoA/propionyl-CoA carboxylase biotin carboxyl carrier protein
MVSGGTGGVPVWLPPSQSTYSAGVNGPAGTLLGRPVYMTEHCAALGTKGDIILVLEAMKMEQPVTAHKDGTVSSINAPVGQTVSNGHVLLLLEDS